MTIREWKFGQAIIADLEAIAWLEDVDLTELLLCLTETDVKFLKKMVSCY